MFVFVIILIIVGVILLKWLKPYLEYKKIGSYAEYEPVSKSLHDKYLEYSWYQINGFKNIDTEAIEYLRQVSKCCTKNDLKWLNQCSEYLKKALIEIEENDENKLFLPLTIENTNIFDTLKVIKRCRKYIPENYQKMGCLTCGEASVMIILIDTRVEMIKSGKAIKPGDMDRFIDAIDEINGFPVPNTHNNPPSGNQSVINTENKGNEHQKQINNEKLDIITDAEKQKLASKGKLDVATAAYNKAINGDSQAMTFMGTVYDMDLQIPEKAFYWMQKAVNKGNDQAEYFLGTYYADGYGVEKDRTKGISIILSSASKGNKDAIDCCMNKMEMSIEEMRDCGIPV